MRFSSDRIRSGCRWGSGSCRQGSSVTGPGSGRSAELVTAREDSKPDGEGRDGVDKAEVEGGGRVDVGREEGGGRRRLG